LALAVFACSDDDVAPKAVPDGPDSGVRDDGGAEPVRPEEGTDIVFPEGTKFQARDCTLTLRYTSASAEVKIAGEFTGWAQSPRSLTRNGDTFEITLAPGDGLASGALYAYKLIDG